MKILEYLFNSIYENYCLLQVFIIILCAFITHRISSKLLEKLQKKTKKNKALFNSSVVKSIKTPLSFLILALAITFSTEIIYDNYDLLLFAKSSLARSLAIVGIISWFLIKLIKEVQTKIITKSSCPESEIDRTTIDTIANISLALVIIITAIIILQTIGFKIGGVLALGGVGGIAVGFAAKDLLANFFGGLMIYFDHPFQVGDWIKSPDKAIEGTVIKIGWRQTQIITFDHRPLYIPNSVFSTIVVENPSRMTNRRIYETIGVRYDDINKVEKIVEDIKKMLSEDSEVDHKKTIIVNVVTFASSSVDFFIYVSTVTTNWVHFHKVKQDILLKTAKIIADNKAEIAFPTSTINLQRTLA
jgi:MscS family membrane protein